MAKATTKKPKRKRKSALDDTAWYVVEIERWEWDFFFGIRRQKEPGDPYDDYRHLVVWGQLVRPSKMSAKEAEVTFVPSQYLNEEKRERLTPTKVGRIQFYRGKLDGHLSIPFDVLPPLLTVLSAGRVRYLTLEGGKARYGNADIARYAFRMNMADDDPPPET
jgi:hypothetical protein